MKFILYLLIQKQSIPLSKQVEYYSTVHDGMVEQLGSPAVQKLLSKSLFAVVIGSNDVFGYTGYSDIRKGSTPQQYVDLMVSSLKDYLKVT